MTSLKFPALVTSVLFLSSLASHAAIINVPLNYNFNGIVHIGEAGNSDAPNGFRSISDRALDFRTGLPTGSLVDRYRFVEEAGTLDIVHLGNRNNVDNGRWSFDLVADNDNIGVQPSWLIDADQSGPQQTILASPILLDSTSSAGFLFNISNGGGSFEVVLGFQGGTSTTATLTGADWFGGAFLGTADNDIANSGNALNIQERIINLSTFAGETLQSITFQNRSNPSGGYAIYAANIEVVPEPSASLLLGLAGISLLSCRRRRDTA